MFDLEDYHKPDFPLKDMKIATAGSCFAQHIGAWLKNNTICAEFMDVEPAPPFLDKKFHQRYGYDLFSARYGNIYTVAHLLQLIREAKGKLPAFTENVWPKGDGWVDPFRPTIEPEPYISPDEVIEQRKYHLAKTLELFSGCDVFIFTAGLTEAWVSKTDGAVYPVVPGSSAGGQYDPDKYEFKNFNYMQISRQLDDFYNELLEINPSCKLIFTVSPVPLTATAVSRHVLTSNSYSKSTLRAVIGDFISRKENTDYFPSYEIISSHVTGGSLFMPDKRRVSQFGVNLVMNYFAQVYKLNIQETSVDNQTESGNDICDEQILDAFRHLTDIGVCNE